MVIAMCSPGIRKSQTMLVLLASIYIVVVCVSVVDVVAESGVVFVAVDESAVGGVAFVVGGVADAPNFVVAAGMSAAKISLVVAIVVDASPSQATKSSATVAPHLASTAAMAINVVPYSRPVGSISPVAAGVCSVDRDCCRHRSSVAPNGYMAHVHIWYTSVFVDSLDKRNGHAYAVDVLNVASQPVSLDAQQHDKLAAEIDSGVDRVHRAMVVVSRVAVVARWVQAHVCWGFDCSCLGCND